MALTTNDLVQRFQAKDPAAFEELYEIYFDKLYSYVISLTRNKADTQDIIANTFLKVFKYIQKFKPRHDHSFQSWLFKIASNEIKLFHRQQKKYLVSNEDYIKNITDRREHLNGPEEQEQKIDLKQDLAKLKNALATVSSKNRELIILRYLNEMTYKDIAKIMGIKEQSIRVYMQRALLELRQILLKHNFQIDIKLAL